MILARLRDKVLLGSVAIGIVVGIGCLHQFYEDSYDPINNNST